jgi:HK97 family phage major capsid protein
MDAIKDLNELRSVDELRAHQADVRSRITALHAEYDGLPFSEEARNEFASLTETDEEIEQRCVELEARTKLVTKLASNERNMEHGDGSLPTFRSSKPRSETRDNWAPLPPLTQDKLPVEIRERAKRAVELMTFDEKVNVDATKTRIESIIASDPAAAQRVWATSNPIYERAFFKKLANRPLSGEEERVLSISGSGGDGTEGNLAVPVTIDPTIILTGDIAVSPLRRIARVVQISGNIWRGIASDGIVASYDAEMTETDDDSPTLSQPEIEVEKAQAFVPFSIEIGEDWGSLRSEMTRAFAEAKANLEADKFLNGAGAASNEPEGLLTGATNLLGAGGTLDEGDLFELIDALPDRYQDNAVILMSRGVSSLVRQLGTGDNGLWADSLQAGIPSRLLGYPVYLTSGLDSTAGDGDVIAVIGDFSRFVIVDRVGLNVELIPHLFGTARNYPNGMRGLYAYWRNSSGVVDANAFRVLMGGVPVSS